MCADIHDAFDLGDFEVQANPRNAHLAELPRPSSPSEVTNRFDLFGQHRDRSSRNIVGLKFAWESTVGMLYDWYQSRQGVTVSLEAMFTISRVRPTLITVRVRHSDHRFDLSTLKLGRTCSIHPDAADSLRARHAILDAIDAGESPLWRLASCIKMPGWVGQALHEPMRDGEIVGHLDKKTTEAMILVGAVTEEALLDAMGC